MEIFNVVYTMTGCPPLTMGHLVILNDDTFLITKHKTFDRWTYRKDDLCFCPGQIKKPSPVTFRKYSGLCFALPDGRKAYVSLGKKGIGIVERILEKYDGETEQQKKRRILRFEFHRNWIAFTDWLGKEKKDFYSREGDKAAEQFFSDRAACFREQNKEAGNWRIKATVLYGPGSELKKLLAEYEGLDRQVGRTLPAPLWALWFNTKWRPALMRREKEILRQLDELEEKQLRPKPGAEPEKTGVEAEHGEKKPTVTPEQCALRLSREMGELLAQDTQRPKEQQAGTFRLHTKALFSGLHLGVGWDTVKDLCAPAQPDEEPLRLVVEVYVLDPFSGRVYRHYLTDIGATREEVLAWLRDAQCAPFIVRQWQELMARVD